ncbi:hypothetical protein FE697_016595 [Mumia zhuanghuii]|uniref:DoxX family protein n=2 Tax=Mumia TaxID=1546255 RepID=A0ABW1QTY3_9ACTN|nr:MULTISPECIES: hypothetical protein [Mumia]KAA1420570.1 hypothetical protein FE697_016595 [Mumia zhuanghuii]
MARPARDVTALAVLLGAAGVTHFVRPRPYERIVPKALPAKRELVYASGVAELVCAVGLVHPRTRKAAGYLSTALLVAVFPANIQMAVDVTRSRRASAAFKAGTIARLPMQLPLIRTAWKATREVG